MIKKLVNKKDELKFSMEENFNGMSIPQRMKSTLAEYVIDHSWTGGFLERILINDLVGAVGKADNDNIKNIPAYINWLYNYAPTDCWGSKEKYEKWIKNK